MTNNAGVPPSREATNPLASSPSSSSDPLEALLGRRAEGPRPSHPSLSNYAQLLAAKPLGDYRPTIVLEPHPLAPRLSGPDKYVILDELFAALESPNGLDNAEVVSLVREASLVSLFFFLKVVAGHSGPYDKLSWDLHVDLCNFRQAALSPGIKAAAFVPRSSFKSQCVGETVMTSIGPKKVEDISIGDQLISVPGSKSQLSRVTAVSRDFAECIEVKTTLGRTLRIADFHGFMTEDGWVLAKDLEKDAGLKLAIRSVPTKEGTLDDWCQGIIWGDGSLTVGSVRLTSISKEILELFDSVHPFTPARYGKCSYCVQGGNAWWKTTGLPFCKSVDKFYPEQFEGNAAFLRGLFDTDGFVASNGTSVGFSTTSEHLAKGVQRNLLHFGVISTLIQTETPSPHGKAFYVVSYGRQSLENFSRHIGFVHKERGRKLALAIVGGKGVSRVYETIPPQIWKKYIKKGESTKAFKKIIRTDNHYWMTTKKIKRLAEVLNRPELLEELNNDYWWDFVKEVKPIGVQEIVHIEVEDVHEYVDGTGVVAHNSTVMTHGAAAWELLRNPAIRIGIFSSKYERAAEFMHTTQRVFDDNDAVAAYFPEYIPSGQYGSRWNDREAVLPNRPRNYPEPNLKAHSAGGSTAGVHVDLALFDDIIDDSQLNADHGATADLYRMKNWLFTNMRTLLVGQESRVVLSATRYAIDDPYEMIMADAFAKAGYWGNMDAEYPTKPDGEWIVYYRKALENGASIFPEAYTEASLTRLASTDPWTYQTQYLNDPKAASILEFLGLKPKPFTIDYDVNLGDFILEVGYTTPVERLRLSDLDVVIGVDPAASERYASQRTSKTAIVVLARDWKDRVFVIEAVAGYWAPSDYIDRVFKLCERYRYSQRAVYVEMQAGFKVLEDSFREEQRRRNIWLSVQKVSALAHKEDTIRAVWEPVLRAGRLYANMDACAGLIAELALFPSSPAKDLLDAGKIAITGSRLPDEPASLLDEDPEVARLRAARHREIARNRRNADPITGY